MYISNPSESLVIIVGECNATDNLILIHGTPNHIHTGMQGAHNTSQIEQILVTFEPNL